jgi:23S rRNA pseudouridine2604 synthase
LWYPRKPFLFLLVLIKAITFLAKQLNISNKEALDFISGSHLLINGKVAEKNHYISPTDLVCLKNKTLQEAKKLHYISFYKPRGIECTLNPEIPDNLLTVFSFPEHLFPIGRLDKESEGLLILTNDGKYYNQIAHSEQLIEKEYEVKVNKLLTETALISLREGIEIMGQLTRPSIVNQLDEFSFNIILTQGLNRQIRRMCYKIGYEVIELKRIRIANFQLGKLKVGEWKVLNSTHLLF